MAENNLGAADARFEGDADIASISTNRGSGVPTAENPGDVHPEVDPVNNPHPARTQGASIFHSIENPYALKEALNKLESALDDVIGLFQGEGKTLSNDGDFESGKGGIKKFQQWKEELEEIKQNKQ